MSLILAVFWTAFIVYGLVSEPSGIPRFPWLVKPGVDKVIHAILFAVEAGLLTATFSHINQKLVPLYVLLWCFLLGGMLEVIQYYWVNGRNGDVVDLLADIFGAVAGIWFVRTFSKK